MKKTPLGIPQKVRDRLVEGFDPLQSGIKTPALDLLRFAQLGVISERDEPDFPDHYIEMLSEDGHTYYILAKMHNYVYGFTLCFFHPPEGARILRVDSYKKPQCQLDAYHNSNRPDPKSIVASLL